MMMFDGNQIPNVEEVGDLGLAKQKLTKNSQSVDDKWLASQVSLKVGGQTQTPESILEQIFATLKQKAEAVR